MPKKCILCEENADLMIKGTSDFYCKLCAVEQFGDIGVLVSVDEEAQQLKEKVDEIITQADEVLKQRQQKTDDKEHQFKSQADELEEQGYTILKPDEELEE